MIATTDRLDRYWAHEIGCDAAALYRGGVQVYTPPHRESTRWMGWIVPCEAITLDSGETGTVAISMTAALARCWPMHQAHYPDDDACVPPRCPAMFHFIRTYMPPHAPKVHRIHHCDPATFTPVPPIFPIEPLHPHDPHADWYRLHFDGPVFVARDPRGSVAAWAALKYKSDDVWEMAVMTEVRYRNRGMARTVVSHATQVALEAGKVPLYLHEINNEASARVCAAVGYRPYGYEFTCETGRILPR